VLYSRTEDVIATTIDITVTIAAIHNARRESKKLSMGFSSGKSLGSGFVKSSGIGNGSTFNGSGIGNGTVIKTTGKGTGGLVSVENALLKL